MCFRGTLSISSARCCKSDFTQTIQNLPLPGPFRILLFFTLVLYAIISFWRKLTYFLFCSYLLKCASRNTDQLGTVKFYSWLSEMHLNAKSKDDFIIIEFKGLISGKNWLILTALEKKISDSILKCWYCRAPSNDLLFHLTIFETELPSKTAWLLF